MKHWFNGLMGLALLLGTAREGKAQPVYSFTTLDRPGSSFPDITGVGGINASGQIVGSYHASSTEHSFLYDQRSYTTLDVPGALWTNASGINASGQIVGNSSLGSFLLDNDGTADQHLPLGAAPFYSNRMPGIE